MQKIKDISAIILSGGKSSRMGSDKALLEINGKSLLQDLIDKLDIVFENILISSDLHGNYQSDSVRVIEDIYKEYGPLGGLHSGLIASKTEMNFVIPCDLPLIRVETIREFVNDSSSGVTVSEFDSKMNPFPGIYPKRALDDIEAILEANENLSMFGFLEKYGYTSFDLAEIKKFSSDELLNMNKPEDYENVKQMLSD